MSGVWCVVTVKRLAIAKQRLAVRLSPDERRAFVLAMLRDVMESASAADVSGLLLATSDPDAAMLGRAYGSEILADPAIEAGLSASVGHAIEWVAQTQKARRVVVLAADLPFARADDISALANAGTEDAVVLASDRAGTGTNAIALDPVRPIPFAFGPESFQKHWASAQSLSLPVRRLDLASLAFDVDTPADFDALVADPRCTHAREFARQIVALRGCSAA